MKRIWPLFSRGPQSGQVHTTPSEPSAVLLITILMLGVLLLVLGAFTTWLGWGYNASNGKDIILGLFAYLLGLLTIIVLIGLSILVSFFIREKEVLEESSGDEVFAALSETLNNDPEEAVRAEAAKELARLDVELSTRHHGHQELDELLIAKLDSDKEQSPRVRIATVDGLGELEVEEHAFSHT